jgi:hypothetical protein
MSSEPETRIQARHPIRKGPIYALRLPLAGVAPDPASSRLGSPTAATDDDVFLRLALWLADVAAEAGLAGTARAASSRLGVAAPHLGRAEDPPVDEPAP